MNALEAWARAALTLGISLVVAACASPPPPAPLPMAASQPAGEPLPIDGLWETRAAPALEVRIEAARIFLARDANDGRPQGSLLYADLEQAGPLRFTCSRPLQRPGALDWQPCTLTLGEDGSLRAVTPDPEHPEHPLEQRFVAKTLSDETWFQAQIDSDEIVSAQDAHAPPPAPERARPGAMSPDPAVGAAWDTASADSLGIRSVG